MKILFPAHRRNCTGFTLIEVLMYIFLLALVTGAAGTAFFRSWDASKALARNAENITRTLDAGESWRADIRTANGPIRQEGAHGAEQLRIPTARGDIVYSLVNSEIWRHDPAQPAPVRLLGQVASSRMQPDPRTHVTAWSWDVRLQTRRHTVHTIPQFRFEAVPEFQPHQP
ncbi:MAG: prepilin-type N-terminal cleavage/methylation domain-containing protein [Verrucomicrobiota bacterium]